MERNSVSYHPNWENNIKETTTKLIIGSMPPKRLCLNEKSNEDIDYYYGSKDNYFWNIMNYMDKKASYNDLRDYKLKDVKPMEKSKVPELKKYVLDGIKKRRAELGM